MQTFDEKSIHPTTYQQQHNENNLVNPDKDKSTNLQNSIFSDNQVEDCLNSPLFVSS